MDNNTGMSVADVAALSNGGFGGGCNSLEGLIYLAVIMGIFNGGFGGFGFGGNGAAVATGMATQNDLQRGFDNQNTMANQREILAAVTNGTAQTVAATNQTFHDTIGMVQNRYDELARDISGVAVQQAQTIANMNECCCSTKMMLADTGASLSAQIARNNYDAAMRDAATNANFTAQIQSVKDEIAQNKIEALQAQVSQLQLAQATAGMLKFPNSWTYGAGPFPPIFGCGCGANGNI